MAIDRISRNDRRVIEIGKVELRKRGINYATFKKRLRLCLTEDIDEDEYVNHYNYMAICLNLFKVPSVRNFAGIHLAPFDNIPLKKSIRDKYNS